MGEILQSRPCPSQDKEPKEDTEQGRANQEPEGRVKTGLGWEGESQRNTLPGSPTPGVFRLYVPLLVGITAPGGRVLEEPLPPVSWSARWSRPSPSAP